MSDALDDFKHYAYAPEDRERDGRRRGLYKPPVCETCHTVKEEIVCECRGDGCPLCRGRGVIRACVKCEPDAGYVEP